MNKKNKTLKIVKGGYVEEGVIVPEYKSVTINANYSKRYNAGFNKLMELNYCELYLLTWLAEQATPECVVYTSSEFRLKFINFILLVSQSLPEETVYQDNTIKAAIQKLKKLEFLIAPPAPAKRGWCWLNPKYYFKGSEEDRYRIVKDIENSIEGNVDSILYDKDELNRELKEQ